EVPGGGARRVRSKAIAGFWGNGRRVVRVRGIYGPSLLRSGGGLRRADPAQGADRSTPRPAARSRSALRRLVCPAAVTSVLVTERLPAEDAALPVRWAAARRAARYLGR